MNILALDNDSIQLKDIKRIWYLSFFQNSREPILMI